jgi:hypothetical protein
MTAPCRRPGAVPPPQLETITDRVWSRPARRAALPRRGAAHPACSTAAYAGELAAHIRTCGSARTRTRCGMRPVSVYMAGTRRTARTRSDAVRGARRTSSGDRRRRPPSLRHADRALLDGTWTTSRSSRSLTCDRCHGHLSRPCHAGARRVARLCARGPWLGAEAREGVRPTIHARVQIMSATRPQGGPRAPSISRPARRDRGRTRAPRRLIDTARAGRPAEFGYRVVLVRHARPRRDATGGASPVDPGRPPRTTRAPLVTADADTCLQARRCGRLRTVLVGPKAPGESALGRPADLRARNLFDAVLTIVAAEPVPTA